MNLSLFSENLASSDQEENAIKKQADAQAKKMNLKVVRLRFNAHLLDQNGICKRVLPHVISNPIYDSSKYFWQLSDKLVDEEGIVCVAAAFCKIYIHLIRLAKLIDKVELTMYI